MLLLVITVIIKNTNAIVYDAVIFFGPGWVKQFWAKPGCHRVSPIIQNFGVNGTEFGSLMPCDWALCRL